MSKPNVLAFTSCSGTGNYYTDCDIEMNPSFTWTTGNAGGSTVNIEAIILHELGHVAGLRDLYGDLPELGFPGYPSDVSPDKKVMFGIFGDIFGNMNLKTLSTADRDGVRWMYPGTINTSKIGVSLNNGWWLDSTAMDTGTPGIPIIRLVRPVWPRL